jgi:hypothetical protein
MALTVDESRPSPEAAADATGFFLDELPDTQLKGEEGLTNFWGGLVSNFAGKLGRELMRPFPSGSCDRANWPNLGDPSDRLAKA